MKEVLANLVCSGLKSSLKEEETLILQIKELLLSSSRFD